MTVKVYNSANYTTKFTGTAGSGLAVLDIILLGSGWTKPFTGTNVNVYRNGAGSKQAYFRIDDTGSTTGLTRNIKIRGYSTMVDSTDTGTNPFPTTTQASQGYFIRKSTTTDAVNREWFAVVDEQVCYLFIYSEGTGITSTPVLYAFGDILSDSSTDIYQSFVSCIGVDSTSFTQSNSGFNDPNCFATTITTNTHTGCAIAGTHTGTAGALLYNKHLSMISSAGSTPFSSPEIVPGGVGQFVLSPMYVHYNNGTSNYVRGVHQGLWVWYNDYNAAVSMSEFDSFYIKNTLTNKVYKLFKVYTTTIIAVEISDTWYQ